MKPLFTMACTIKTPKMGTMTILAKATSIIAISGRRENGLCNFKLAKLAPSRIKAMGTVRLPTKDA
jgi:hypothetical protein